MSAPSHNTSDFACRSQSFFSYQPKLKLTVTLAEVVDLVLRGSYSATSEFSSFQHKYDLKHGQIFTLLLKLDKGNPIKQIRQKMTLIRLLIVKNYPILNICVWQKHV